MQLIDYLPLHAEWGVVDWAPLILLRGTEGNKSSLETCANFRAKNYTPCFFGMEGVVIMHLFLYAGAYTRVTWFLDNVEKNLANIYMFISRIYLF